MDNIDFKFPLVSIVIVNYNGEKYLKGCFNSVFKSDYPNFAVIFIDDASTDKSLKIVRDNFGEKPLLTIVRNKKNFGPSRSRNIGINYSKGEYIAFLDNDVEVKEDWLKEAVKVFQENPQIGAAQCKLILSNDRGRIDSCGHYLSIFGFPFEVGVNEYDTQQYNRVIEIFGGKSAALVVRSKCLDLAGRFDPDYFIYGEDTDICWRIWLTGYKVVFIPNSVVYHKIGGSLNKESNYRVYYEGSKNNIKNLIKNLGLKNLLWIFPLHSLLWLFIAMLFCVSRRFKDAIWIYKGILWNIANLKNTLKERKRIQSLRKISDYRLFSLGEINKFSLLMKKGLTWIGRL